MSCEIFYTGFGGDKSRAKRGQIFDLNTQWKLDVQMFANTYVGSAGGHISFHGATDKTKKIK